MMDPGPPFVEPWRWYVDAVKIVTCACGQQWRGTETELVPLVRQHGHEIHNMDVTADQVRALAVDADADTRSPD